MGLKLLRNIVLVFFVNIYIVNCTHEYINNQEIEHFNTRQQHGIILHFPKYSIKVFAERKPNTNPNFPNIYHNGGYDHSVPDSSADEIYSVPKYQPQQPSIYQPHPPVYLPTGYSPSIYQPTENHPAIYQPTENHPAIYQPTENHPTIYQPTEHKPNIEYYPTVNEFPLIHREPIEKPKCDYQGSNEIPSEVPYDPIVGLPKSSRKHSQTWFYGAPNWQTNNQNILRSETPLYLQENADQYTEPSANIQEVENGPDPRMSTDPRFIHSSSKFVKVHKPFGSKLIISKQKIIGHHGGGGSFGGHGGHFGGHGGHFNSFDHFNDFDHHSFGGVTNVNKNTNIHVHSRNVEHEKNAQIKDDNKREAKEQKYDRIIGSHLFAAPRWRRDTLLRKKRGVIDAVKLVTDHRARIDVPKTAENVGAATRNLFEEDYSPVYHLRNALASAHDVIYSMMNVRPNGILIPCRYKIVDGNEASPIVGAINPELLRKHGQRSPNSQDQLIFSDGDPMHRMGEVLRDSIKWAHKSAEHAADAMHSARKAVVTARKHWPKLFVPYVRAVEIVQPKLGHEEEDIVGSAKDPEFVGVGRIMDYLGMTDKKPDFSPQVGSSHFGLPHHKSQEEITLQKAKESLGSPSYQQFMSQMKNELNSTPLNKETVGAPRLTPESIKAKLALERLRNSIKLQKAKAELQLKSRLPAKPIIPKLPIIPRKPLLLPKHPILRLEPPKTLTKTPALSLKSERVGAANPNHGIKPPEPTEISDPIEQLKYKINEHLNVGANAKINQLENEKNIEKHLNELKDKLYEKYNIEADSLNHSDILGLAIEEAQKNNPNVMIDEVGSPLNEEGKEHVASVPNPVYTKEMQTPFMGLVAKEEIDKYFQQLYDSNNDKKKS